jgi:hypothetical protein
LTPHRSAVHFLWTGECASSVRARADAGHFFHEFISATLKKGSIMKHFASLSCAVVMASVGASIADAAIFARDKVNVMNSYNVKVTSSVSWSRTVQLLVAHGADDDAPLYNWTEGAPPPNVTIDFGSVRNVKTINLQPYSSFAFGIGGALIEASSDGVNWQMVSSNLTHPFDPGPGGTPYHRILLADAIDTRYLRLTATSVHSSNTSKTVGFMSLEVFGTAGMLEAYDLDLVAGTGLQDGDGTGATPPVKLTMLGGVKVIDALAFVNDTSIKRNIIYDLHVNQAGEDGFVLQFDQPYWFDRFGYRIENNSTGAQWTAYVGDGTNWTQVGSWNAASGGLHFQNLTPALGTHLKITVQGESSTQRKIGDIMVFQVVPEPGTLAVASLGMLAMIGRRRRA